MKPLSDTFCLQLTIVAGYVVLFFFIGYLWHEIDARDEKILQLRGRVIDLEGQIDLDRRMQEIRLHDMTLDELYRRLEGDHQR